jgi:hypothetical protein
MFLSEVLTTPRGWPEMTPESRARETFLSTATSTFNNCIHSAAQFPEALRRDPTRRVFSAECAFQPRQNLFPLALVHPALDLNLSHLICQSAVEDNS